MLMPFQILGLWLRGLLSIAIIVGGIYLLNRWYDESHVIETTRAVRVEGDPPKEVTVETPGPRVFRFDPGWNRPTAYLAGGVALLVWATLGRLIGNGLFMLTLRSGSGGTEPSAKSAPSGVKRESKKVRRANAKRLKTSNRMSLAPEPDDDPLAERGGEVHTIKRPDGSVLRVECYGPADAPPIVMTHGWGANSTEWFYQKRHLAGPFRLILWDEPGLGLSKKPDNNDYRLENLAADLEAVLTFAGRPAVLLGHSIGGMITLTFCKDFPQELGTRVAGLVLAHTSYTNPVRTTKMAGLYTAIEKPVLIPLMYLTIGLWPLAWLMSWLNFANGSAHRSTHSSSFSGNETWGQLDFCARFMPHGRPDVLARGMLGMIAYDATTVLKSIKIPTLVVVGDQDSTTLPEAGQYIAKTVPRARLATLTPGQAHGANRAPRPVRRAGRRVRRLVLGLARRSVRDGPRIA